MPDNKDLQETRIRHANRNELLDYYEANEETEESKRECINCIKM